MHERSDRRREEGAALLVAIMLMVFMGVIGLAAMDVVTQDKQVAGTLKRTKTAFYAAEAGIAVGRNSVRLASNKFDPPVLATTNVGTASDFPHSTQPQYRGDPNFTGTTPHIRHLRDMPLEGFGLDSGFVAAYWAINVQGDGPSGGVSRVEVESRIPSFLGYGG